jgi:hypothetical protein
MQPDESSGTGAGKERDLQAWLEVLTPAVEGLLRYTEQQLEQDVSSQCQ